MALTIRGKNIITEIKNLQEIFELKTATQVIDKLTQINIAYNELRDEYNNLINKNFEFMEKYKSLKEAIQAKQEAENHLKQLIK